MGPRLLASATLFYGALILVAGVIGALFGRNVFDSGGPLAYALSLGVASSAAPVALGVVAYKAFPVLR